MYQRSLHELIDAAKKMKVLLQVDSPKERDSMAQKLISEIPKLAADSICFYTNFDVVPDIDVIPELVRLPYQKIWVEFECDDVGRCCLLCHERGRDLTVTMFVKNVAAAWIFNGVYMFSLSDSLPFNVKHSGRYGDEEKNTFRFLFQYLSALNCCNITRTEHKPKPSQQSVRRALGRQPLFSTWTLEIDLDRTERELPGESCGGHASKRLHLCRGHARQHKPGQWCWVRAHVRGDKSLGMIHKDYATH